ncbi:TetR/AcrR family transcriptional regulator [Micromonospora sp. NPDC050686]|uniref:TetR/AcrR family transcriptional regulator n=1 Tax=Micromonospora sp. NPDC050686 TaxID=3154631 RepID=UPI0033C4E3ED
MNRREYRQGARAVTARLTGERIIDALVSLFLEQPLSEIRLADVAQRAGVTVQTVIRRFDNKNGLVAAAVERVSAEIATTRATVPPGDVGAAVANLVEHYEKAGDLSLKLLAEEPFDPSGRSIADIGREVHRRWCETAFASALDRLTGSTRQRRLAQLVAICDVSTWKLLRRDAGLSRGQTELALTEMLAPLTEET